MDHYCFAAAAARRFTLFIQEAKLDLYETPSIYGLFQAFPRYQQQMPTGGGQSNATSNGVR
jgi:hypothetical protein